MRKNSEKSSGRIFTLIMALCAAMTLCMDFSQPQSYYSSAIEEIFSNLSESLYGTAFVSSLLAAGFYALGRKLSKTRIPGKWAVAILSMIIGAAWLFGMSFLYTKTLSGITASFGQMLKSAIYFSGASWMIYTLLRGLYYAVTEKCDIDIKPNKFTAFVSKHLFLVTTVFLLLCWAIPTAIMYPAAMTNDTWNQLSQFFGINSFEANNPPVHSAIVGGFCYLGMKLGSANLGIYMLTLLQTLLCALTMAYSVCLLKRLNAPRWLMLFVLVSAGFSPYIAGYAGVLIKDVPFSIAVLLAIIELIYALLDMDSFLQSKRHMLLTALAIIGAILMRNVVKYILYPIIIIVVAILLIKKNKLMKKRLVRGVLLLLLPTVLASAINTSTMKAFNIGDGSIAESLSMPFQQTARYVWQYGDEVTDEEQAAIAAVLPYDELATLYNPALSDPVKNRYNCEATGEELRAYFATWFKMFFKHPAVYIEATVAQTYPLVDPLIENRVVFTGFGYSPDYREAVEELTGLGESQALSVKKNMVEQWFMALYSVPIVGMMSNSAPYTIIALFLSIVAIAKKRYRFLIPALPVVLSVLVILAAPVIMSHPRYAFPIIYTVPVLLGYFNYLINE